jgi:hypothetical protein
LDEGNSTIAEFIGSGLPPNINVIHFPTALSGNVNLYTLTANDRYRLDRLGASAPPSSLAAGTGISR